MLLSALRSNELGITFAAVHDSFWTHASDVDTMSDVLREAFIKMHSEDIITRLAMEFTARYKGYMYLASVPAASAIGRQIFASRFPQRQRKRSEKQQQKDELLEDCRRRRLLASEDPAERAEGEP